MKENKLKINAKHLKKERKEYILIECDPMSCS